MINHVKKRVLLGQHDHSPPESSTQFYCIQIQLWWHWYEFSSVLPSSSWHYHTLSLRFQDSITLIIFVIVVVELDCASAKASYLNQKWSGIRIWISRLFIWMSAGLLPKWCGFTTMLASAILLSVVKTGCEMLINLLKIPYSGMARKWKSDLESMYGTRSLPKVNLFI